MSETLYAYPLPTPANKKKVTLKIPRGARVERLELRGEKPTLVLRGQGGGKEDALEVMWLLEAEDSGSNDWVLIDSLQIGSEEGRWGLLRKVVTA